MPVYATHDADGGRIARDAAIVRFVTKAEARAYLLRGFDADEWDHETAVIAPGDYGDAWLKWMHAPRVGNPGADPGFSPFTFTQLLVQAPGEHPGGQFWWITPRPDVLTVAEIHEREIV